MALLFTPQPCLGIPTSCFPWGPSTNHCAPICMLFAILFCPYTKDCHPLGAPLPSFSRNSHSPLVLQTTPELQASPVPIQSKTEESKFQVRAEGSLAGFQERASTSCILQMRHQPERECDSPVVILTSQWPRWVLNSPSSAPSTQPLHCLPTHPTLWWYWLMGQPCWSPSVLGSPY